MWTALIPDGPMHPRDAVTALVVGAVVALIVRRSRFAAPVLAVAALAVFEYRHGGTLETALLDRADPVVDLGLAVAAIGALAATVSVGLARYSSRAVALSTLAALTAVWGLVPDTEAPLIAGAVVAAAVVIGSGPSPSWARALVPLVPVAALVGTIGRPGRLLLALGVAVTWAAAAQAGLAAVVWLDDRRRQRAGTPTTVTPAATSVVTTAPAPTTAP